MSLTSVVRIKQLPAITGLSRATIWRLIKDKEFPAPFRLAKQAVGWEMADIESWIKQRKAAGQGAA